VHKVHHARNVEEGQGRIKKIEAAHGKFQRRLLGITWSDKVRISEMKTSERKLVQGN